eukprot:4460308-Alexandrium_andersonii.AAC.1
MPYVLRECGVPLAMVASCECSFGGRRPFLGDGEGRAVGFRPEWQHAIQTALAPRVLPRLAVAAAALIQGQPDPEPPMPTCQRGTEAEIPRVAFTDGSVRRPLCRAFAVGGAGVWWPGR